MNALPVSCKIGRVEKALQEDDGGEPVDGCFARRVGYSFASYGAFGLATGPPFIAEFDGQSGLPLQFGREFPCVLALAAGSTAHMQRIADEEASYAFRDGKLSERFDILTPAFSFQSFEALRGQTEFVADGKP